MTTNAVFPAILGFLKGVLLSLIQKKGFRQFERCFARFSPQKPFFLKTLGLSFSLVFSFSSVFLSTFHVFFINPFWDIMLVLFLGFIFVAAFLSSVLPLSFQPVSCHRLLQSTLRSFVVVSLFYSSSLHDIVFKLGVSFFLFLVGFCLVFFWLLLSPFFITGVYSLFFFLLFLVKQLWRRLFWVQISDIGKRCFPCGSGGFLGKWLISNFGSGCSASLTLGSWVLKTGGK